MSSTEKLALLAEWQTQIERSDAAFALLREALGAAANPSPS